MEEKGFTLIEMVVVLAVVAILAAILVPTVAKHIEDAKLARATNEVQVIGASIASLYKDTGFWPYTNAPGPSGGVNRVISDPVNIAPNSDGSVSGAANWASMAPAKPLYDYLFYNNPDEDTGAVGMNQPGEDYPTSGEYAWRGPYLDEEIMDDPWGYAYVINARYFPGNSLIPESTKSGHRVYILCAGPNKTWETPFSDGVVRPADAIGGDDIGLTLYTNKF
ncbi:MAG: prepilin-type N-terminal cleavage/methylation domain-containing protein [Candidatus Aminicenantes bacterium]|nr:prepilin-type N-terminal cleavage/methylation domain-containing protein [Candidatus Aminicenantes bacterium]